MSSGVAASCLGIVMSSGFAAPCLGIVMSCGFECLSPRPQRALNEMSVSTFFDILEKLQGKQKFTHDRILNVEETVIIYRLE